MKTNYDNIDFCLQILFDFAYDNTDKCLELKYGPKKNIDISMLKKPIDFDYEHIFKAQITFHSGNHNKLIFKRSSNTGYPSLLRISKYATDTKLTNLSDKHMIDMKLNYIIGEIAVNDEYKFLLFPIMNFDIKFDDLPIKNDVKKHYETVNDDDMMCIQMFENYYKMETLKSYLDKNYNDFSAVHWKVLAFQIVYILCKIQKMYPLFRHNMLDLESFYVYDPQNSSDTYILTIDNYEFVVPNLGFNLKITNFYKSNIPTYADNIHTTLKQDNQYYDIHYIFSTLLNYMDENNINDFNLKSFINEIIPQKFISTNIGLDEEYYFQNIITILNPFIIITKNIFFSEFIKDNMNRMKRPSLNESSIRSSSMTDSNTNGFAPSLLSKKVKSTSSVVGTRQLHYNVSQQHEKTKYFNDYGDLTETKPNDNHTNKKQTNKKVNKAIDTKFIDKLLFNKDKSNYSETSNANTFEGGISTSYSKMFSEYSIDDETDKKEKKENDSSSSSSSSTTSTFSESSSTTSENKKEDKSSSLPDIPRQQEEQLKNSKNNGLFNQVEQYGNKKYKHVFNKVESPVESSVHKSKKHKSRKHKSRKHRDNQQSNMPKQIESALPTNYNGPIPHELLSYLPQLNTGMGPNMMGPNMMGQQMNPNMMGPNMMGPMNPNMMGQMGPNMNHPLAQMGNPQLDMMGPPSQMGNQMSLDNSLLGNQPQYNQMMNNQQMMMDGNIEKDSHASLLPAGMLLNNQQPQVDQQQMQQQMQAPQVMQQPQMEQPQVMQQPQVMEQPQVIQQPQMQQPQMDQQQMEQSFMAQQQMGGGKRKRRTSKKNSSKNDFFFLREEHRK